MRDDDDLAALEPNTIWQDFTNSLYVPGRNHLMHNAGKDMVTEAARFWTTIFESLSAVVNFFHDGITRDLFVTKCLDTPPWSAYKYRFRSFPYTIVNWRWNCLWLAVKHLVELMPILRGAWDLAKMGGASADPGGADRPGL